MQKRLSLLLLIGLATSCAHQSTRTGQGENFESIPVVGNFVAKRTRLENGLKLIVLKDSSSTTFAYQTWFDVGSRHEVPGKTGLAHLFEHMMFKGTKSHAEGEFDALLEQAGVEDENAFTTNDHTVYVQELPKSAFDLIVGLESDRMTNLIVNDESFKMEREVVQNERRFRKENSAEGTIYQELFETAFQTHPYHWPVIGYEQDLNLMSAQDARNFYERFYNPSRATVIVVGDVDENEVYRKVKRAYGSIPALPSPLAQVPITPEPEQLAQRRRKLSLNVEVEKLWMAYKIGPANSDDTAALEIIQSVLSEGKNCRLNRALVDTGIASQLGSGSLNLKDPGAYLLEFDMQKGKSSAVAEAVVLREIERLKNSPIPAEEIKRAQSSVRFRLLETLSTLKGKARYLGETELQLGGLERANELQKKIMEISAEDVQKVAQKYFKTQKLTVVSASPKK